MAQARRWCFTYNNPSENGGELELGPLARGGVYQLEQGEQGTRHFQGYVEFTRGLRLSSVRKLLPNAHWEPARGTATQASEYCTKEASRIGGPWTFGAPLGGEPGKRSDLEQVATAIKEGKSLRDVGDSFGAAYIKYHRGISAMRQLYCKPRMLEDNPEVIFIWGPTGAGKSRVTAEVAGGSGYWKDNSKWWDDYAGESCVIWDEFRGSSCSLSTILRYCDRYPCRVEFKGGSTQLQASTWIFTSNQPPWLLWKIPNLDTWYRRLTLLIFYGNDDQHNYPFYFTNIREAQRETSFYVHDEGEN